MRRTNTKNKFQVFKKTLGSTAIAAMLTTIGLFSTTVNAQDAPETKSANPSTFSTTGCVSRRPLDFDGDGKTDPTVVRNTGGGATGAITWFIRNSTNGAQVTAPFGQAGDIFVPSDYDGDSKADIAVWRGGTQAYFYILQSQTGTFRAEAFGQEGDDPTVVGDYTGDGKADPAVYRVGANAGNPSFWYYRASSGALSGQTVGTQWGRNGDFEAPGDYDGDGRYDFVVQRNAGGGAGVFYLNQTTAGQTSVQYGTPTDVVVPGDYDGDCKTDIAVARSSGGVINWFARNSSNGATQSYAFGSSSGDYLTQGDYDGDGRIEVSVWRQSNGTFFWRRSIDGALGFQAWGGTADFPPANFNTH